MKPKVTCQACGSTIKITRIKPAYEGEGSNEQFGLHTIAFPEHTLQLVVCLDCDEKSVHDIFDLYRERIRSGKDPMYH